MKSLSTIFSNLKNYDDYFDQIIERFWKHTIFEILYDTPNDYSSFLKIITEKDFNHRQVFLSEFKKEIKCGYYDNLFEIENRMIHVSDNILFYYELFKSL